MQRIGLMLVVVSVIATGCGARTVRPALQSAPGASTSTTEVEAVVVTEPSEVAGPVTTTTTNPSDPEPAEAPDVAVDEIDSIPSDIDETLAELDQLLNQAAAALAAEEGEIIP